MNFTQVQKQNLCAVTCLLSDYIVQKINTDGYLDEDLRNAVLEYITCVKKILHDAGN